MRIYFQKLKVHNECVFKRLQPLITLLVLFLYIQSVIIETVCIANITQPSQPTFRTFLVRLFRIPEKILFLLGGQLELTVFPSFFKHLLSILFKNCSCIFASQNFQSQNRARQNPRISLACFINIVLAPCDFYTHCDKSTKGLP